MTIYEHTMFGVNGALAAGLHRRYGWQIVALAGLASLVPDADGLTLLIGPRYYAEGHRIWTHNLLVAGITAAILAAVAYESDFFSKIYQWLKKRLEKKPNDEQGKIPPDKKRMSTLLAWMAVGILSTYAHLLMDVFFSGGRDLPVWGVPVFWPFSHTAYAYSMVPWGDVGATLIFIVSMFAMLHWKKRVQSIAAVSLLAVAAYIILRGVV
jgi:membrane-bound metal-dependent hydrolase YbcI (DUF457 family)